MRSRSSTTYKENSHRIASDRLKLHRDIDPQGLLTPDVIKRHIDACLCPYCGAGPFKQLGIHTARAHSITANDLKRAAGLTSTASTAAPEIIEFFRKKALFERFGSKALPAGDPKRIAAGEKISAWHSEHPLGDEERAQFAARMSDPEIVAKRNAVLESTRAGHGTEASYKRGCRCALCREARRVHRNPTNKPIGKPRSLSDTHAREIRERRSQGETLKSLASAFGVSVATVSNIANGKTYTNVAPGSDVAGGRA